MPPLPESIILVLALFASLFAHRVWLHTQRLVLVEHHMDHNG
jgi:uncharacterized GH25 family protein